MSLALACAWTFKGDYRFEGDWTQLGNSLGAAPEAGLGGGEGGRGRRANLGLRAQLLVAVVWAFQILLGDGGWGSGLRPLAPSSERQRRDFGFRGAVFGLEVLRPFPRDEGDTLNPLSQGRGTLCPAPFLSFWVNAATS